MSDDLVVTLVADAAPFASGLAKAKADADAFREHVEEMAGEVAAVFGLGFGVEKGAELIKSSMESAWEAVKGQIEETVDLGHQAEKLGLNVNELRALRLEATHTGTAIESVTKAIFRMQVNLADPKKEGAFKNLGLDAAALRNTGVLEAFGQIGDKIAEYENQVNRASAVHEVFGKTGMEAMNVILEGSEGLEKIKGHMTFLSDKELRDLELAHEGMLHLKESTDGLSRTFAIELAPAIQKATDALADFLRGMGMGAHGSGQMRDGVLGAVEEIGRDILNLSPPNIPAILNKHLFGAGMNMFGDFSEKPHRPNAPFEQTDFSDAEKELDTLAQHAADLREKVNPSLKLSRQDAEFQEMFNEELISAKELAEAMREAGREFAKEMEKRDPLTKLKKEAQELLKSGQGPDAALAGRLDELGKLSSVLSDKQMAELNLKAFKDFATAHGAGAAFDGDKIKIPHHHKQKIFGGDVAEFGAAGYRAFFQGLNAQPDTEAQKQTQLQQKLVQLMGQFVAKRAERELSTVAIT
jgi:hypothetical protein